MARRFAAWLGAAACLVPALAQAQAVALMYHHVGVGEYPSTNVTVEQFERHLEYLAEHDYRVLPLSRIVRALRAGESLPPRTVAITFDDAYLSVYTRAYPRLQARGWPFTVFVNTDSVGGGNFMDWAQMREMARDGAEFGNHSASHDYLIRRRSGEDRQAWLERVGADIDRAQAALEGQLPESVTLDPRLLAYPFGEYNAALAQWVADNGYVAFGQHSGALGAHTDWRAAPRFPINERYAEMDGFARKVASLPLPVARERPFDPVVEADNPPALEVVLAEQPERWRDLRCYVGGEPMEIAWQEPGLRFRVRSREALSQGRSRYNCTVPAEGRFRWYSHLWIIP
ncbi:polysaccharide deacetylase family protein [Ectothiorhodospiraceae bacterium WFHF3C12]|nr:polysaccharide deacetylase family protein [Ectothiorhodospiraceae bacterium WFHF3C12]